MDKDSYQISLPYSTPLKLIPSNVPCLHGAIHIPKPALKLCLSPIYKPSWLPIEFRIKFHSPAWYTGPMGPFQPSDLLIPNRKQTLVRLFYLIPRIVLTKPFLHPGYLLSADHILSSFKAQFQAHLFHETFSDHSISPRTFIIRITLLST